MISFKNFRSESFSLVGDMITIDYKEKSDTNKLTFGKGNLKPYVKKLDGIDVQVISLYTFKDNAGTILMKKLKAGNIDDDMYERFLVRSSVFTSRLIRDLKIDLIVLPESSSPLASDFAKKIVAANPGIKLAPKNYVKAKNIDQIEIDRENPRLTDSIIKGLESSLRRAKKEGVLKMKWILPVNRKFLKNIFSYEGNSVIFESKNVLIIDDIVTSGSSILPVYKSTQEAGASSVTCLTLFKSST